MFAPGQKVFESDRLGNRSVIKEKIDLPAGRQVAAIRPGGVHPGIAHVQPFLGPDRTHPGGLAVRKDREENAVLGKEFERLRVHRRFREPHSFGTPVEPVFEIPDSPDDLGALIARVRQGHDDVVVHLGNGVAVA
jgi:hypothetical protein